METFYKEEISKLYTSEAEKLKFDVMIFKKLIFLYGSSDRTYLIILLKTRKMTNIKKIVIEKIQHSEIKEIAGILTDAFITNPAYSIVFKKKSRQREGLLWLFKASLILDNHKQKLTYVIKEKDTGKIIGTFTLIPPQGVKKGITVYSKIGIVGFIAKFGLHSFFRMLRLDDCNKLTLKKSIKTSTYYYLSMVVIRKEYRGMGIGSYAIRNAIEELIASKPSCNMIGLTTQLPENVTFYSRMGFELLDEGYIDFEGDKYSNYNMKLNILIPKGNVRNEEQ